MPAAAESRRRRPRRPVRLATTIVLPSGLSDTSMAPSDGRSGAGVPTARPARILHSSTLLPKSTVAISRPSALKLGGSLAQPGELAASSRSPAAVAARGGRCPGRRSPGTRRRRRPRAARYAGCSPCHAPGRAARHRNVEIVRSVRTSIRLTVPSSWPAARMRPSALSALPDEHGRSDMARDADGRAGRSGTGGRAGARRQGPRSRPCRRARRCTASGHRG